MNYVLKLFLTFRKFEPRHSYELYSFLKKVCTLTYISSFKVERTNNIFETQFFAISE